MKRTWKFWLGLGGLFLVGLLLGAILGAGAVQGWVKKLATAHRGELESMVLADWKKKLSLNDEQAAAIKPLLSEAEGKILPLRDHFLMDVNRVLTELHPKVQTLLDDKQRQKYDSMVNRYESKVGTTAAAATMSAGK